MCGKERRHKTWRAPPGEPWRHSCRHLCPFPGRVRQHVRNQTSRPGALCAERTPKKNGPVCDRGRNPRRSHTPDRSSAGGSSERSSAAADESARSYFPTPSASEQQPKSHPPPTDPRPLGGSKPIHRLRRTRPAQCRASSTGYPSPCRAISRALRPAAPSPAESSLKRQKRCHIHRFAYWGCISGAKVDALLPGFVVNNLGEVGQVGACPRSPDPCRRDPVAGR